ncbi:MAG: hypothetical protein JWL81_902, partial [Verrucomicrobiales bacterium]|nr:hypothetical protein [Verrucomicrobiales bacterium]
DAGKKIQGARWITLPHRVEGVSPELANG